MRLLQRLQTEQSTYRPSERKLVTAILADPQTASAATIQELARLSAVSTATISRFVKAVGCHSFREFSVALARSQSDTQRTESFFGDIADNDTDAAIQEKVFQGAIHALQTTKDSLLTTDLTWAAQKLIQARRIGFFGIGGSSVVAFNAYHKFLRTPLTVIAHPDYDIQLMQAVQLTTADVAVVISHSGRNKDTLLIAKRLCAHNVPVIAITAFTNSPLAKMATCVLPSLADEVNFRSESMSSLIAQLTIVDALFTLVGSRLAADTQAVVDVMRHTIEETR